MDNTKDNSGPIITEKKKNKTKIKKKMCNEWM